MPDEEVGRLEHYSHWAVIALVLQASKQLLNVASLHTVMMDRIHVQVFVRM